MIQNSVDQKNQKKEVSSDLVTKPFTLYIAGSDSRDEELTSVTGTDVNIMLTVDPVNQTVLEAGVPRDAYIPNPGLNNGLDKLTHLGVLGIDNTLSGISSYFNITFSNYVLVNFNTYSTIIDALDGIEVDNPYEFTTVGGNGGSWNIVKYRLQERDGTEETASAPGEELYVGWLYDSQVQFVEEQMNDMLNGQKIVQTELPEGASAQ